MRPWTVRWRSAPRRAVWWRSAVHVRAGASGRAATRAVRRGAARRQGVTRSRRDHESGCPRRAAAMTSRDAGLAIGVLGPGGVGGLIAGALDRSGAPVTVVARKSTAAIIGERGL